MFATKNKSATKNFRKTEQQNHPTSLNTLQNRMSSVVAIKHAPLEDQNISNENMQISIAVPVTAVNWFCVMKLKTNFQV